MSAAVTEIPPLWLRHPEEVTKHLEFASSKIKACVLSVGGYQVFGWMSFDGEQLVFAVHERLEGLVSAPRAGQPVECAYEAKADRYQFLSSVEDVIGPMHWVLARPATVERRDKRVDRRIEVVDRPGFNLEIEHPDGTSSIQPLLDLSAGGFAFLFSPHDRKWRAGELATGVLHVEGLGALVVQVEIRHTRDLAPHRNRHAAGTRLRRISYSDRMALTRFVAAWRK